MATAVKTTEVEIYVVVDQDGQYAIGVESGTAADSYEEEVGAMCEAEGIRTIKITLTVPLPTIVEMYGVVPAQGDPGPMTVA